MKKYLLSLFLLINCVANAATLVKLQTIINNGVFRKPDLMTYAPGRPNELFVVEQAGFIKYFEKIKPKDVKILFDMKGKVESGGEKGLLGLAFHPNFQQNGFFFTNYTARGPNKKLHTFISRFKADPKTLLADPDSEKVILTFEQPYENHNGGTLVFGPDGFLYVATGDGGLAADPHNNGQNIKSLLGKILRLNINIKDPVTPEIFAYGLRNPWKISFDLATGVLWAADVGQNSWEEIDIIEKGKNYGWRLKEGNHCFIPPMFCPQDGLTNPVFEYRNTGDDCSITGGYVYRGTALPFLSGNYIYGDYCSGKIWAFDLKTKTNKLLIDSNYSISSFGQDQEGEIYILNHKDGSVAKLVTP